MYESELSVLSKRIEEAESALRRGDFKTAILLTRPVLSTPVPTFETYTLRERKAYLRSARVATLTPLSSAPARAGFDRAVCPQ